MSPGKTRVLFSVFILFLLSMGVIRAQGGLLENGATVSDKLSAATPQILYIFNGNAGEIATIHALGWGFGFQPTLTLLGPTGQLAFNSGDALNPLSNDARVTVRLPQPGAYSLLVGSTTPVDATFTLSLQIRPASLSIPLGESLIIDLVPGAILQTYSIEANPGGTSDVVIEATTPGFNFSTLLSDPSGKVIAALDGNLARAVFTLPAAAGAYELFVAPVDPNSTGAVRIARGAGSTAPVISQPQQPQQPSQPSQPVATEEVGSSSIPANQCVAVAGGSVNVRSGPGTDFGIVGTLSPGGFLVVTGQYQGWYTGPFQGVSGWVAGSVTSLQGPCGNVPVVQPPAGPSQPQQPAQPSGPAPTSTSTPPPPPTTAPGQPTSTPTTPPPPPPPTATFTPTSAVQTAPPDADSLNWTLDRNAGGQFSDAVSFPSGDTTDRIRVTVDGLNNQPPNNFRRFQFTLVCTGTNTQNLGWGTGGPSAGTGLSCGGSLQQVFTNDSNQLFINVRITSGDPSYVQYTIIATRID